MGTRTGIELVRYAVHLLDQCNESFNQRWSESQLLSIAKACQESKWDIYPDRWTERQVQECVQFGMTPQWEDKDGNPVPKYHNTSEDVTELAVVWTMTANVTVYADSPEDAIDWAQGDMPIPKNGEYLDDSFEVDLDATTEVNQEDSGE